MSTFSERLIHGDLNRREMLFVGRNIFLTFATLNLGGLLTGCSPLKKGRFSDWKGVLEKTFAQGVAFVQKIEGRALVDGIPVQENQSIPNGKRILVEAKSLLFATLPDSSVLKATGKAELLLNLDPQSGGVLQLYHGSLLSVIQKRNRRRSSPYIFK